MYLILDMSTWCLQPIQRTELEEHLTQTMLNVVQLSSGPPPTCGRGYIILDRTQSENHRIDTLDGWAI